MVEYLGVCFMLSAVLLTMCSPVTHPRAHTLTDYAGSLVPESVWVYVSHSQIPRTLFSKKKLKE